jgi:hypothetical protein
VALEFAEQNAAEEEAGLLSGCSQSALQSTGKSQVYKGFIHLLFLNVII